MRLLIVTQKVDRTDPILGFFHRWLEEFAAQCTEVHVIGQLVGEHDLPTNVHVYSLGKEKGESKFNQIRKFWKLQHQLQKDVDAVLVHMTPIWIVLGCFFKKPKYLWYEARGKGWPLKFALNVVEKVFSASAHGMPLRTKKSVVVGHGIDLEQFTPSGEKEEGLLVTVGRITRAKHVEVMLEAFAALPEHYRLQIVGTTITEDDEQYLKELGPRLIDRVEIGSMTQAELIPLLQRAEVFLHASSTPLDKAVLEALACGCPVISTSSAVQSLLPPQCHVTDAKTMAYAVTGITEMNESEMNSLQRQMQQEAQKHSLQKLISRLVEEMQVL